MASPQLINTIFPPLINSDKELKEGINYTDETIKQMSPISVVRKIASTIAFKMRASAVIDAIAGIGGNSIPFAFTDGIDDIVAYEENRAAWTMLHNNKGIYNAPKISAYNQEFNVNNEDLQLRRPKDFNIHRKTVVYMKPNWFQPGKTADKTNYMLSGIRVARKTLEEWAIYLCHSKEYRGVVFHLPAGYRLALPGQLIDDVTDPNGRLIYYSTEPDIVNNLSEEIGVKQEGKVQEISKDKISSAESEIEELPTPNMVKGPKVILQTFLTQEFPMRNYYKEPKNPKAIHLGQRKLMNSEVEFLTRVLKHKPGNYTLLYIGAAPGNHIPILSDMFPEVKFELWDPADFAIKETSRIKIHKEFFTTETMQQYMKTPNLLLVSDIRTTPYDNYKAKGDDPDKEFEDRIIIDMNLQKQWVLDLKPMRSLLKFRFPFIEGTTDYFDGIFFFQAYPKVQSAETRLEVGPHPKIKTYDHTRYERQMFYFNTIYRVQSFQHYHSKYGWSYDTIREYFILKKYLDLRGRSVKEIPEFVKKFDKFNSEPGLSITRILEKYD